MQSGQAPLPLRELWQLWAQEDTLGYFDMFFWNIIGGFGDILIYYPVISYWYWHFLDGKHDKPFVNFMCLTIPLGMGGVRL